MKEGREKKHEKLRKSMKKDHSTLGKLQVI